MSKQPDLNPAIGVNGLIRKKGGSPKHGSAILQDVDLVLIQNSRFSRERVIRIPYHNIEYVEWRDGFLGPAKIKIRTNSSKKFYIEKNKTDKLSIFYNSLRLRVR